MVTPAIRTVRPIIRKKRRRSTEEAHHGGAWKIAYADFVTAMMAFFLLLWLINVTSPDQKTGIAEYFNPITVSQRTAGSGGVLDGTSVSEPGPLQSPDSQFSFDAPLRFAPDADKQDRSQQQQKAAEAIESDDRSREADDRRKFDAVKAKLLETVSANPELRALMDNLIIDETPEGLRIQLVDRHERPMFPLGDAAPFDHTRLLLTLVTDAIGSLPNEVSIRGHTDSLPFASNDGYDNWNLSSDRALAARRLMIEAGLAPERLEGVVGRADRDPLFPADPTDPRNRRLSIVLLRETAMAGADSAAADAAGPPHL